MAKSRSFRSITSLPAVVAGRRKQKAYAYKWVDFKPPLYLFFPAVVQEVYDEHFVQVEFSDGGNHLIPIT